MQSAETTRTFVSRRNILSLPSSWQTNNHFKYFWKTRWFSFTGTRLEGQNRPHCEFLFKYVVGPVIRNALSLSRTTVYSSPGKPSTCPERTGKLCWAGTLPCISRIISGCHRQVFVKFNAGYKKGKMVSSQNFYVTTRKEKIQCHMDSLTFLEVLCSHKGFVDRQAVPPEECPCAHH